MTAPLEPDQSQIELFTAALFCRAGEEGFVSVRAFYEDDSSKPSRISSAALKGGLSFLNEVAVDDARRAAQDPKRVVFCPPLAVFSNGKRAREVDIAEGLALSVECDKRPQAALAKLEGIIGPATVVVRSGGTWVDPKTGKAHDKLHLHWRLQSPARDKDTLAKLKQARDIAARLVGGDPTNKSVVHPIRWPGSWHRKATPTLCSIVTIDPNQEIDLDAAVVALIAAAPKADDRFSDSAAGNGQDKAPPSEWAELIAGILAAKDYHNAIARLAMKLLRSGMSDGAAVNLIRSWMDASTGPRDPRWQARYNDIPRAVRTAREKIDSDTAGGDSELPELIINEADPTATAKQLAALIAKTDNFLFNGYAPVRVAVEENCLPRAIEVTVEAVRVLAHEICRPTKLRRVRDKDDKKKLVTLQTRVPLSKDIALLYLNGLEGQWGLRRFRGITTAPLLKNDGSLRSTTGYDAQTGLWCHNIPKLEIADRPTKQQAEAALARLRFFFRTFPFADGERIHDTALEVDVIDRSKKLGLDESTFLAALLAAACRQSLDLAPGYLVRGPSFSGAGTGKGLAVKALCVIGSGVRPAAFTSGHDAEEFNKRLTAALVEAHPAVFLDNFNAKELKSDVLASALTEDPAMVRPMGHTKMVPLHTRTFIAITGNAVEIAEDMARRITATDFDAKMEDPESRSFAPGFLDQVFTARTELLTDALTIWRWGRQTKLKQGKPLGNYERWAQWCRDPLLALGARDPVDRIAEIKAADPRRRELVTIFDAWWAAHGDATIKTADIAPKVIELIDAKATRRDDGSLQFSRQWLARFLDRHAGTCVGGCTLQQIKDDTRARPVAHYKLINSRQD